MNKLFGFTLIAWGLVVWLAFPGGASPRLLNVIIMGVYVVALLWWYVHEDYAWVAYWFFAFGITYTATFLINRG